MELERKGVTITWHIENVRYVSQLYSPVISIDVMDATKWKLGFHRELIRYRRTIQYGLTLTREADDYDQEEIELHYQFSFSSLNGTSSTRDNIYTHIFQKNQSCPTVEVDRRDMVKSLSSDTITIQCKIWRKTGTIIKNGQFFIKTRMRIEHCIFTGRVENFSDVYGDEMVTLKTITSSTGENMLAVNLRFFIPKSNSITMCRQIKMEIVFIITDDQPKQFCYFKSFILDSSGNKTDTGMLKGIFKLETGVGFTLPGIWQEELWEKADQYLVNDTLSLHCEITFCSGIEYENVERTEYESDSLDEVKETDFLKAVEFLTSRENRLCDMKLQTATVTFPVHTAILSARSPVFEAMFKTNMKEAIQKCIHIDDMETKTIKHMLVFLYSDTLEELDWKDAMKLYFAADKYLILSLKRKCADFLKESIDLSNCCVLLHLADMYQDEALKKKVIKYIDDNDKKVIFSDQWRDLEKTHPHLAITFFRDRYMHYKILY